MKRTRIVASTIIVLATTLGACGSDGGDTASFADQLQETCRSITRNVRAIDDASTLDDYPQAAGDASSAYSDGLAALGKLTAPSKQRDDFKELQANVGEEIDLLDAIADAAEQGDVKTVTTKIAGLSKLEADNGELADSLDASSCAFPAVFTAVPATTTTAPEDTDPTDTAPVQTTRVTDEATTTPATRPATTRPATTQPTTTTGPGLTLPPLTNPPTTTPPVSQPPGTGAPAGVGDKQIVQRASQISPAGAYTFVDSPDAPVSSLLAVMNLSPVVAPQAGLLFGVDVIVDDIVIARVISFVADGELTAGSAESLQTTFAVGNPITPTTIAGVSGGQFTTGDNLFFVAADSPALVITVAKDQASLEQGFTAFAQSIQNG